ncbi:MAG: MFS transporter [Nocardioidaceae bacterium]
MTAVTPEVRGTLRADPDFRRYFAARLLSQAGTIVTVIALPVLVYRISDSAPLTAIVLMLEAAPYLLFGLFAGALSDRLDRRRVMVVADVADAVLMGSVPVAHLFGVLTVPHLLVVAFGVPAIAVFFDGANFGALPVLVGTDRIAKANAVIWSAVTATETVLPSLLGLSLAVIHPSTLLGVDALSFAASAALVRTIARPLQDPDRERARTTPSAVVADIKVGLRFLVRHPGVRTMTIAGALQCIVGGGFVALMVVWFDRVLDIGTEGWRFGLVWSSWSVGALVASLALPRVLDRTTPARITLAALPVSAVLGIATSFATSWPLAALGLLTWSGAYMLVVVNSVSYRQQVTPEPLLGRVNTAGRMLAWGLGWTVGAAVAGALSSVIGVRSTLHAVTCVGVLAVLVAWTSPLRRADTPAERDTSAV